jgi:LPPG:FO 2-phospho-L-lactate transferase
MALEILKTTGTTTTRSAFRSVVALAGGVGGAKFADGLAQCLPPGALTVIVNTGDDFQHYGLTICPDLDTVTYTLGGVANVVNGWGLTDDSQQMLGMMRRYGDEAWFGLGDKDVATHLLRSQWLREGQTLSEVTQRLAAGLGITSKILPMSDDPAPTLIDTVEYGILPFQEYFVRYRWQPTVKRVILDSTARPTAAALAAVEAADLIVICPSNPMLSIEPLLKIGFRDALTRRKAPCVAISPLVGGQAIKGPAAKLMTELSLESSANGIAHYYGDLIDGLMIQTGDVVDTGTGLHVIAADIVMHSIPDRARLAQELLTELLTWDT